MQLFITEYSPYVRMTRILLREKGLQARVEEVAARTREKNSPYYEVNSSGRVPYLLGSNNVAVQGSRCLLYTSPSPRDATLSRMPSSA